jgi:signal transduction histidine kinase
VSDNDSRQQTVWQIALLSAGFLILTAIGVVSVYLVNTARTESNWIVHTIESEGQISRVMLDLRTAESAARGYVLTQNPQFLADHDRTAAEVLPAIDALRELTADNPIQTRNVADFHEAAEARLNELRRLTDLVKQNDVAAATDLLRSGGLPATMEKARDISARMQREEDRLFALRTATADRSRLLSAVMTIAGAGFVVLLAILSIFLVRRSLRERDLAERQLRDTNLNLETIVDVRTADLLEANEEIQRFAYIVSHDLRSPLVNIMGFTSELEELRSDIFSRIARLARSPSDSDPSKGDAPPGELVLDGEDKKLAEDFSEALGFIKSSIGKMDRLITAILNLTREGRREFRPELVNMGELINGISATVAHQAIEADARIEVETLPNLFSDRLALEQIFSNLIDNALKYLKPGVPGNIAIRGRRKLGFAIFEVSDNGRGIDPKDHQRIFDLFRRAGTQDRPGQGIGLAHVRALVRRMGGSMSVDSKLNQGSTFFVTLPLKLSTKEGHSP